MILESLNCPDKNKQNPKTKKNKSKCNACGQKKSETKSDQTEKKD